MTRTSFCFGWRRNSRAPVKRNGSASLLLQSDPATRCREHRPCGAFRRALALALLAVLWAVSPAAASEPAEYTLGAGDSLRVTVFGQEDLSGEFTVDGQGSIAMPLIGNVAVGNLTLRQAEAAIVDKLKPDYLKNPRVSIEVLNYRPFYILGEVKKPGSYPYVSGMTVINAVALGGGYTHRARENDLLITRGKDPERKKQKATHDTIVLPGDVIEVPERYF